MTEPATPGPRSLEGDLLRVALGAFAATFLTDAILLLSSDAGGVPSSTLLAILWEAASVAGLAAAPLAVVAYGLLRLGGAIFPSRGFLGLLRGLPFAAAIGAVSAEVAARTLIGRGVNESPKLTFLRDNATLVAYAAAALASLPSTWLVGLAIRRRGVGVVLGAAALFLVAACGVFDATVHADRYAAAHAFSRLCAALLGGGALVLLLRGRPRPRLRAIVAAGLCVALLGAAIDPLRTSSVGRVAAFRDTIALRLALSATSSPEAPRPLDPEALAELAALSGETEPDERVLDEAFPSRREWNLLFLTIDAWRGDSLDRAYDGRLVMPRLRRYAEEATWFRAAWTPFPATSQAFASTFSGLESPATDVGRAMSERREFLHGRSDPVLPEILSRAGYRAEAIVGFPPRFVRDAFDHVRQGFGRWNDDPRLRVPPYDGQHVASATLRALDREPGTPFFIWAHFLDAHGPYRPLSHPYGDGDRERYDAELTFVDDQIARVLDGLDARGLTSNTVVVLFGDHGEQFGDRGPKYHGTALSEAQIHVPLIFRVPGAPPRRVRTPVSLVDVAPTILRLKGLPRPPMHGRSLLSILAGGDEAADARPVYSELVGPEPGQDYLRFAVRDGRWKYRRNLNAGGEELVDLEEDPHEKRNLVAELPHEADRMRRLLDVVRTRAALPPIDRSARAPTNGAAASRESAEPDSRPK
jgi:arylsulfatase A-like enzyme